MTAMITCAISSLKTVFDNLIHSLEVAPMIVALTDAEERLDEYPDHEPHARFLTEELVPRLERGVSAARRALGARSDGGELRRRRGALAAPGATLVSTAACSCNRARSRSPTSASTTGARAFDPVVKFVNAFRKNARAAEREGVHQLRQL